MKASLWLEGGIESSIVSSHEIIFIWSSLLQSFHDSFSQYILVSRFDIKNIHPKDYLNVFILIFSLWWLKIPLKSWSMGSSLLQVDMITIHSSGYHRLNSSLQKVKNGNMCNVTCSKITGNYRKIYFSLLETLVKTLFFSDFH